jgi:hypothetical protein
LDTLLANQYPKAFAHRGLISDDAPWVSAPCTLAIRISRYEMFYHNSYSEIVHTEKIFGSAFGQGDKSIGFRWDAGGGRYKYGYLRVTTIWNGDVYLMQWGKEI